MNRLTAFKNSTPQLFFGLLCLFIAIWMPFSQAHAQEKIRQKFANHRTLPPDNVPWDYTNVEKILAIGDLHGDFESLLTILYDNKLIDQNGRWVGGKAHVVLAGDLVRGRPGSRFLQDYVMDLQKQAEAAGGHVHALLGNHDLIFAKGEYSHVSRRESRTYVNRSADDPQTSLRKAYSTNGRYGEWMKNRNMIVKINENIFVHAGIHGWGYDNSPEQINATARAWIAHWQGEYNQPPENTAWVVGLENGKFTGDLGPAWQRSFKVTWEVVKNDDDRPDEAPKRKHIRNILELWGGSRFVVGHAPTPDGQIYLEHPFYGANVALIDTKISDNNGRLLAMEVNRLGHSKIVDSTNALLPSELAPKLTRQFMCRGYFE